MKVINKLRLFVILLSVFVIGHAALVARADGDTDTNGGDDGVTAGIVQIVKIDYNEGYVLINPNGNSKVYYTQTSKNAWYEVEGGLVVNEGSLADCLKLDISWISDSKEFSLTFKGNENDEEEKLVLPAANTGLKAKFAPLDNTIDFDNVAGAAHFQWRKATSNNWENSVSISNQKAFSEAVEALRVKGGKIVVRIPGEQGDPANAKRPSKSITLSISKRANSPSLKVDVNKLTLNTSTAMEYMVYAVGGDIKESAKWVPCHKNISLAEISKEIFVDTATDKKSKDVVVAVRKAATGKASHSKTAYFTIPAQTAAPSIDLAKNKITQSSATKFSFSLTMAGPFPYQYAVAIKSGDGYDESNLVWKNVSINKNISFSSSKIPSGSVVYIRERGVAQSSKATLRLPSAYSKDAVNVITIEYIKK